MKRLLDAYYRFLCVALAALMALMIVPITLQILSRFSRHIPRFIWTEEVARFCFVWIIMLGAMIAVRDRTHFDVDLLPSPRTARGRAIGGLVVHGAMLLMAVVFVWYGWGFTATGWVQTSEMSGINMASIYVAFPMAGVTWVVFLLEKIVADVRLLRKGSADESA
jgi:TRAP-type C4-dicarboxylate transport system permease small subunit